VRWAVPACRACAFSTTTVPAPLHHQDLPPRKARTQRAAKIGTESADVQLPTPLNESTTRPSGDPGSPGQGGSWGKARAPLIDKSFTRERFGSSVSPPLCPDGGHQEHPDHHRFNVEVRPAPRPSLPGGSPARLYTPATRRKPILTPVKQPAPPARG
jgi:hypothetical protein